MTENTDKEINAQAERPRANDEANLKSDVGRVQVRLCLGYRHRHNTRGLTEEIVRLISQKERRAEWLLDFRLKAFRYWQTIEVPQ